MKLDQALSSFDAQLFLQERMSWCLLLKTRLFNRVYFVKSWVTEWKIQVLIMLFHFFFASFSLLIALETTRLTIRQLFQTHSTRKRVTVLHLLRPLSQGPPAKRRNLKQTFYIQRVTTGWLLVVFHIWVGSLLDFMYILDEMFCFWMFFTHFQLLWISVGVTNDIFNFQTIF